MNNLDFLHSIFAPIIKIDDKFYAYIPTIFGYREGFEKGVYILLDDVMLENSNLEYLVGLFDDGIELFKEAVEGTIVTAIFPKSIDEESEFDNVTDYEKIESSNYKYYAMLNELFDNFNLTEEYVNDTRTNFSNIILYYSYIDDMSIKTQIYLKVLEFYSQNMIDETLTTLNLILSSTSYQYNDTSTITSCGCTNNQISGQTINDVSCSESYVNAISMYMKQMFSDLDFYCKFMFVEDGTPNEELIDYLIQLLEALLKLGHPMNFNKSADTHCKCAELNTVNNDAYNAIINYIKVLNWVKNCEIEENTNKIKIYGEKFAEVFPYLSF